MQQYLLRYKKKVNTNEKPYVESKFSAQSKAAALKHNL